MHTFVLSETLTYLYLLFKPGARKLIDLDKEARHTRFAPHTRNFTRLFDRVSGECR